MNTFKFLLILLCSLVGGGAVGFVASEALASRWVQSTQAGQPVLFNRETGDVKTLVDGKFVDSTQDSRVKELQSMLAEATRYVAAASNRVSISEANAERLMDKAARMQEEINTLTNRLALAEAAIQNEKGNTFAESVEREELARRLQKELDIGWYNIVAFKAKDDDCKEVVRRYRAFSPGSVYVPSTPELVDRTSPLARLPDFDPVAYYKAMHRAEPPTNIKRPFDPDEFLRETSPGGK